MEPLLSLRLDKSRRSYSPGEVLHCEYQVDAVDPDDVTGLEVSVLWHTEGKGDEDLGVHFFERRTPGEDATELRSLHTFDTPLPNSPLSYDGTIVKVLWTVRMRLFLKKGRAVMQELSFRLLPHAKAPAEA